jgi:hypothetical protein
MDRDNELRVFGIILDLLPQRVFSDHQPGVELQIMMPIINRLCG